MATILSATIQGEEPIKLLARIIEYGLETVMDDLGWPGDQDQAALDKVIEFADFIGVDASGILRQGN